jgi:hypothetical protein
MWGSKRYIVAMVAFFAVLVTAWAKHWLPGISEPLVGVAAGLAGTYIAGESWRPSNGQK